MSKVNEHLREKHTYNIITNDNFPCGLCDLFFESESKLNEHSGNLPQVNKKTRN